MALKFNAFDFYLLRVPRMTSEILHEINGFENKGDAWNCIVKLLEDPEILDAIYLASENFFEELMDVIKSDYQQAYDKKLETLYKYISRMSSRPTPYGKFSGVSLGELSESTSSLELSGEFFSSYRLDMGFMAGLSQLVLENPTTQKQLVYYTNTTLFENADYFKYIDFNEVDNRRYYQWAKVVKNPLLKHILNLAKDGKHIGELIDSLKEMGIDEEKTKRYLCQLIDIKLLISELEPCVTASNFNNKIALLKTIRHEDFPISTLISLEHCLRRVNGENVPSFTFRKKGKDLNLPSSKNLFQADMLVGTTRNKINKRIIEELSSEIEELSVINRAKIPNDLLSFRSKFLSRYGDREIPLLEAIDHENGVGYGKVTSGNPADNPLIQGLGTLRKDESHSRIHRAVQSILDEHKVEAVTPTTAIELDYQDIQALGMERNNHSVENSPLSFYVLGNLLLSKDQEQEKRKYQFNLIAGGGVSSIPLMTRFSHLDKRLGEELRNCVSWDEKHAADVVLAEIVYLPESRVGNILTRPKLFQYEIPIIGQCAAHDHFRIPLDDLWVSIRHGKVILRSKRLNKQIIPRLSSAHNFHYGMVIYRFLCDLQFQSDCLDLSWDWGQLSKRSFLPRVSYKHIILSRAKWNINKTSLHTLNGSDNKSKILSLKGKFGLPDLLLLTNGDNELLIDLRSPIGSEILLKELNKRDLVLHEYLFDQYDSPVRDSKERQYNNEVLIPFKVDKLVKSARFKPDGSGTIKRYFHPGSEWVFIKIYCGIAESDKILSEHISLLKNELLEGGLIEKWFFIRYHDPEPHIRLRFLLRRKKGNIPFQQAVDYINKYLEPLLKSNTIYRLNYDTYERELERYGVHSIELCESLFQIDSESIVLLLPLFKQEVGNHLRWLTAMLGVDHLFSAFGFDIHEKITFVTGLRDAFLIEFSGYDKLKYKLDCKYRENLDRIQNFFDASGNHDRIVHTNLSDRFQTIRYLTDPIKKAHLDDHGIFDLVSSLAHMYINRLFTSKQREQEMIIYHFLVKQYRSIEKRNKFDYSTSNAFRDIPLGLVNT